MARKIKFSGTVGATLNFQSLRIGENADPEKLPASARKMLTNVFSVLAVNGWQCVIIASKDGEVTIADRDNPKMQGVLKMSPILGYPALTGALGDETATNTDGNRVVVKVGQ